MEKEQKRFLKYSNTTSWRQTSL